MTMRETAASESDREKISAQETDKVREMSDTLKVGKTESNALTANQKLLQRLDAQKETSAQLLEDSAINSGEQGEYGMMLCSDRCIKSCVRSGRCFHA